MNVDIKDGKIKCYMTIAEAAKKWGCTTTSVRNWISRNKIIKSDLLYINNGNVRNCFIKEDLEHPTTRMMYSIGSTSYTQFTLNEREENVLRCIEGEGLTFVATEKKLNMPARSADKAYYRAIAKILKQGKTINEYLKGESV